MLHLCGRVAGRVVFGRTAATLPRAGAARGPLAPAAAVPAALASSAFPFSSSSSSSPASAFAAFAAPGPRRSPAACSAAAAAAAPALPRRRRRPQQQQHQPLSTSSTAGSAPFYPAAPDDTTSDAVNNILYNTPTDGGADNKYTLSVLVDNEAGVLSKVSGLLAGRGFNIDSLTVSTTEVADLSRMTIVLKGTESHMEQARKQLEDLVQVWAVIDSGRNAIHREMCLLKVSTLPPEQRPTIGTSISYIPDYQDVMNSHFHKESVLQTVDMFGGSVVDVGTDQMIIELVSWSRRIDAFIRTMKPYGVIEVARSGAITMPRVPVAGQLDSDEGAPGQATDLSALPPS